MEIKEIYGIDPKTIADNMRNALALDQELLYRLESRDMIEEAKIVLAHAHSCYKALASVTNYLEMQYYKNKMLHVCDFNVSDYCKDLFSRLQSKMRRSHIKFDFEIEKGIVARCDPERLSTCIVNVIVNAYTWVDQDEGEIEATVKQHSDYAVVTINDNGCGMSQSDVNKYRNSAGTRGFNILYSFCNSIGTMPLIETSSELGGLQITIKLPLSPSDKNLRLESPIEIFKTGLLAPSEVLLYKLPKAIVKL